MKSMKRSADMMSGECAPIPDLGHVELMSMNFQPFVWGFRSGDSCLSIIRPKKYHQILRWIASPATTKTIHLQASGGSNDGTWVAVDDDSSEIILSKSKTSFIPEIVDKLGSKFVIRLRTKDYKYVRHSNYRLRVDERSVSDQPWAEDSLWLISPVSQDNVSTAPPTPGSLDDAGIGFNRSLFIHIPACFSDQLERERCINVLLNCIEENSAVAVNISRVAKDTDKVISYPLQGAGGMGMTAAGATAISMFRPGCPISHELTARIEAATTVKSRGGISSFTNPSHEVACVLKHLSSLALREMKARRMFGMVPSRKFNMELGFCEWVTLPHGCEIIPHRDGGNDCDVAAIFAVHNVSECTVEETTILLEEGGMYIFEPQKYVHSVGKPQLPGPRHVVALRFFRSPIT